MVKHIRKRTSRKSDKPDKPYPDFPLFPHATRRWAKKIRGKLHYFGPWSDPQGALNKYLDEKDALHAGRTPRKEKTGLDVQELADRFLSVKKAAMERGELSARTFRDYYTACRIIVKFFGADRLVLDLVPDDFAKLLQRGYPKTWGPVRRKKSIQITRSLFKFASDEDHIDRPVKFGKQFKGPSKKTLRLHRAANGKRMFQAEELRTILANASKQLRAMTLLGLNAGFGNNDVSSLPQSALDLDGGWVNFPRPKTGIDRRCKLWPETVEALKTVIATRPKPADERDAGLVFLTQRGARWSQVNMVENEDGKIRVVENDEVAKQFGKLLRRLGLKRKGHNFYTLRRVFETVGGGCLDQASVDFVMGHARDDMASVYRQEIGDDRLERLAAHVHSWLFGQ
jgi:integrase